MKRKIDAFEYAGTVLKALPTGVLLTTKVGEKLNSMTIAWGTIGVEWGKPIFTVFVRENRFTKGMLDENGEFTINVPLDGTAGRIMSFCGTKSGRDTDKIGELGLTPEAPELISVPGIRELPLTLECRVIYRQGQDGNAITEENRARFYPRNVSGSFHGSNCDYHTAYYGEIVSAYIIE